jgi:type III secretory pathway component EscU
MSLKHRLNIRKCLLTTICHIIKIGILFELEKTNQNNLKINNYDNRKN